MWDENGIVRIDNKDIEEFMVFFHSLPTLITYIKNQIGFDKNTNQLKHGVTKKNPSDFVSNAPVDFESTNGEEITIDYINGIPYIADDVRVLGLNQHIDNPYLYISVNPVNVCKEMTPDLPAINNQHFVDPKMILGKAHLQKVINRIANLHPSKNITFVVLGEHATNKNFELYVNDVVPLETFTNIEGLKGYRLSKEKTEANTDVQIYYLDASNKKMTLTTVILEKLYAIYLDAIANECPLVIQCDKGINLSAKLAFAFELFRDFDNRFDTDDNIKLRDKIIQIHSNLQYSCSPFALTDIQDFSQALYIAFAFKIISMETILRYEIDKLIKEKMHNPKIAPKFEKKKDAIFKILIDVYQYADCAKRSSLLKLRLHTNDEVKSNYNMPYLTDKIGKPVYYLILDTLRYLLSQRAKVDKKIVELVDSNEAQQRSFEKLRIVTINPNPSNDAVEKKEERDQELAISPTNS